MGVGVEGIQLGLRPRRVAAPARPTSEARRKPGRVRSIRYQITGLTRARVRETCVVDCQGRRRCGWEGGC